jgi:hypothetical protein
MYIFLNFVAIKGLFIRVSRTNKLLHMAVTGPRF